MSVEDAEEAMTKLFDGYAEIYECCERPRFKPLAEDLVERAGVEEGDRVLDVGTGSGIGAFTALNRVGDEGYVLGIDQSSELLEVGRDKAREMGVDNIEFRRMSMASIDLSKDSFDHVIGNHSLCCCFHYRKAVREIRRVLKQGGRLTYSHDGRSSPRVSEVFDSVFSRFKVDDPSEEVARLREANEVLESQWGRFRDPSYAVEAMREEGFTDLETWTFTRRQTFADVEDYLRYVFTGGSNELELEEMSIERRKELRRTLVEELTPLVSDDGLVMEREIVHVSGRK